METIREDLLFARDVWIERLLQMRRHVRWGRRVHGHTWPAGAFQAHKRLTQRRNWRINW